MINVGMLPLLTPEQMYEEDPLRDLLTKYSPEELSWRYRTPLPDEVDSLPILGSLWACADKVVADELLLTLRQINAPVVDIWVITPFLTST